MAKPVSDQPEIIYSMMRVSKIYNNKPVIKDISLSYFYGAKIGVLGLNGSGKSTVLRIMAGVDHDFNGEAVLSKGYTTGILDQEPQLDADKTVREVVEEGAAEQVGWLKDFNAISDQFADPDVDMDVLLAKQGELQEKIDAHDCWDLDSRLEQAMDALRCPDPDVKIGVLSGGERRRVALCRLLLQEPDILLLDEPTNHLDAESVAWLEKHLQDYKGTVIAVTHDRYFLDHVAEWILELDRGEGIPWKGNYSSWLEQKSGRLAREEKSDQKRQKTLERELEWIRMSPRGQHAKSKDRIANYERLAGEEGRQKEQELEIYIPSGPRLGDLVAELQGVSKAYGDRVLFENLSFAIPRAGILGVIGPNGAGKSTLLRLLTGQEQPDAGTLRIGETVRMAYVDQLRAGLNPEKNVFEAVSGGYEQIELGGKLINARAWLSRFGFSGDSQQKKISELSGGQQNRLNLALTLKSEANLLFFDEPTNDLDVNTMRALEEAIEAFAGSAVLVSHDRWFLDRLATHILAFEGDSQVQFFDGNYSQYESYRKDVLGLKPFDPHRIKYPEADAMKAAAAQALLAALAGLLLGGAALWLGLQQDAVACWGFGGACLLQVPAALSLWGRIRDGLGNSGLERDRLTLRVVSHLLRLLALGLVLAAISALVGERAPRASLLVPALAALAVALQALLWRAKRSLAGVHPALDLDATRTRTLLELAALLLVGTLVGRWFPGADAVTGALLALRVFFEGRTLGKSTTLQAAACGGCGSGCGCG